MLLCKGRVVRKPVNANPGLKVNRANNFSSIKTFSSAYVLCSLILIMLKTEGQKISTEHLAGKLQK